VPLTAPVGEELPDADVVLQTLLNRPEWHQRAACRGMGPEHFYVYGRVPDAAAACARCEVVPSACRPRSTPTTTSVNGAASAASIGARSCGVAWRERR
jgi:Transcription factor WhiB